MKKHIPNAFTCGNLICGCLAIIQVLQGSMITATYLVGMALVFDFFDGFMARLFKVSSPIGKDLDSLADMVTFGVVPGLILYRLIGFSTFNSVVDEPAAAGWTIYPPGYPFLYSYLPYFSLIIPVFSCIRLAKFNNDTRQADSFIGLPTPSNAIVICSIPLILQLHDETFSFLANPYFLCLLSLILSLLLIAEIPLFALKFKNFGWADNKLRFVFLALALVMLLLFRVVAVPLVILLYILLSIVNNIFLKKKV